VTSSVQAHALVSHAIRKGLLVRQPCEVCGFGPAQAHHEDYDKPLDVWWLCLDHHRDLHAWRRVEGEFALAWMRQVA
jgi:hypothetical protein